MCCFWCFSVLKVWGPNKWVKATPNSLQEWGGRMSPSPPHDSYLAPTPIVLLLRHSGGSVSLGTHAACSVVNDARPWTVLLRWFLLRECLVLPLGVWRGWWCHCVQQLNYHRNKAVLILQLPRTKCITVLDELTQNPCMEQQPPCTPTDSSHNDSTFS